jgi:hypothetical protein
VIEGLKGSLTDLREGGELQGKLEKLRKTWEKKGKCGRLVVNLEV